ncbi:PREDICTED: uncharacterized protein LOC109218676 [Nicotiana attenuata]|uniref:uncharacterized protein LOC109218676 n=1 Tax=Nicotiana attenuata TaxID=49451 RepID=UPI0009053F90|nr:PREDICTED: uncharacterized protein LOC109218676 [Nicotiana attenuata]
MMLDLSNQAQSILTSFDKQSEKTKSEYRVRLNASIDVARYLLEEGMSFPDHDERETSTRREIQKDIVSSCAKETLKAIVEALNGDYFRILVDESNDVFHKEQMIFVLHYVNKEGKVIERYLSIVHVKGREMIRDDQAEKLEELLAFGEVHTGSDLNHELGLQREGDTRWGSHFRTVHNFISLFSSIVHVLGVLAIEGSNYHERSMAKSLVDDIRYYDFVYMLHLMLKVLALTYNLNMAL